MSDEPGSGEVSETPSGSGLSFPKVGYDNPRFQRSQQEYKTPPRKPEYIAPTRGLSAATMGTVRQGGDVPQIVDTSGKHTEQTKIRDSGSRLSGGMDPMLGKRG